MKEKAQSRAERLKPATRDDLDQLAKRFVAMGSDFVTFLTYWTIGQLYAMFGKTLTWVVTIPDEEREVIYIREAQRDAQGNFEPGALELAFTDTRNGAWINLRWALARFNKRPKKGRRMEIPVRRDEDPDLGPVLILDIGAAQIVAGQVRSGDDGEGSGDTQAKDGKAKPAPSPEAKTQETAPVAGQAAPMQSAAPTSDPPKPEIAN